MSALFGLPPPVTRWLAIAMVAAVIALVAWALQLMQAANDRQEFSLMLAGCMVCSAAVGLSTVMLLTFTSPETFRLSPPPPALETMRALGPAPRQPGELSP
ncbi:MAG: hypothetical protein VKO39_06170 [Cyanobacteriota bacterium]|nr:hypothetical protein [Cyanobacteriota bacterium]